MQIEKSLMWVTLGLLFVTPFIVLLVFDGTFFPYIFGKNIFFRGVTEMMLVSWGLLALSNPAYRPRRSWVLAAVTVFIGVIALADIFGSDPERSFWSNYERMEGWVTLAHMWIYVLVASVMFESERVAHWFFRVSLAVATLVAGNAYIQALTTDKNRLDSTFGNPIYLAVYALFNIFIACILMVRHDVVRFERILYGGVVVLQIWMLYATASRGAILGLIGGVLVASIGIACSREASQGMRKIAVALIAMVVLVVGGFFVIRESSWVSESYTLKRFTNISFERGTVFARTLVWGMAWEGIQEKPLLGWGQGGFRDVFNAHYDPRMYAQEAWFDRTHNVVLDWLIAGGIVGFLAYLAIFLALIYSLFTHSTFSCVQRWLIVGMLAGYTFHNLTVFDQLSSWMLFFGILAWVVSHERGKGRFGEGVGVAQLNFIIMWCVLGAAAVGVYALHYTEVKANKMLLLGLEYNAYAFHYNDSVQSSERSLLALQTLVAAGNINTYGHREIHEQIVTEATKVLQMPWASDELKSQWFTAAVASAQYEHTRTPNDPRVLAVVSNVYRVTGMWEAQAEALQAALALTPTKQTLLLELSVNAVRQGKDEDALAYAKKAYELEPAFPNAAASYALRLLAQGDIDAFDEVLAATPAAGEEVELLKALLMRTYDDRAMSVWQKAYESTTPGRKKDVSIALASAYYGLGDTEGFNRALDIVAALSPEIAEDIEGVRAQLR